MAKLRMIRETKKPKGTPYDSRRRKPRKPPEADYVHAALHRDVHVDLVSYLENESSEALSLREVYAEAVREWLDRKRS